MLLPRFAVSSFRSFDEKCQPIEDLQKINLFIGQNNAGKSNVIGALRLFCLASASTERSPQRTEIQLMLDDYLNRPVGINAGTPKIWLPLPVTAEELFSDLNEWNMRIDGNWGPAKAFIDPVLKSISDGIGNQGYVCASPVPRQIEITAENLLNQGYVKYGNRAVYNEIFNRHSGSTGGGDGHWVDFLVKKINPFNRLPSLKFVEVPAVRKLIDAGSAFDGTFGDSALIQKVAEWERPGASNLVAYSEKFSKLLHFVRSVLEDQKVELQVPFERNTIHVIKDQKTLPIERLGTGIHQIVMLAAAATVVEDSIFAIEEPETNLHPTLQRKLIQYLSEKTSNQYFITTHSAHILDACPAAVFRVSLETGSTKVQRLNSNSARFAAVEDVGYRASDLIQTPLVIWVEGPSDRIYLCAWLRSKAPQFVEGTHFSIMFYGGRLLSHLSASDPEVAEFVSLRTLNRYVAIVIDSDRRNTTDSINATKQRVADEIELEPLFSHVWITEGKEMENYLDQSFLPQTFGQVVSGFGRLIKRSIALYSDVLEYIDLGGEKSSAAKKKVAFARAYVEQSLGAIPQSNSLNSHLDALVILIKKANGAA